MIDVSRLPPRALIDTGILIRALGNRPADASSQSCAEFFQAMTQPGRELLIAAPSLAEVLRWGGVASPPPNLAGAAVVAFDAKAADILGTRLPQTVLVSHRTQSGLPIGYFKYDALIVACALRWNADAVVTLDAGVHALCQHVGLDHNYPAHYQSASATAPVNVVPSRS